MSCNWFSFFMKKTGCLKDIKSNLLEIHNSLLLNTLESLLGASWKTVAFLMVKDCLVWFFSDIVCSQSIGDLCWAKGVFGNGFYWVHDCGSIGRHWVCLLFLGSFRFSILHQKAHVIRGNWTVVYRQLSHLISLP